MADQWDKITHFAECIPGFTGFSKEDQDILLQVGKSETLVPWGRRGDVQQPSPTQQQKNPAGFGPLYIILHSGDAYPLPEQKSAAIYFSKYWQ